MARLLLSLKIRQPKKVIFELGKAKYVLRTSSRFIVGSLGNDIHSNFALRLGRYVQTSRLPTTGCRQNSELFS